MTQEEEIYLFLGRVRTFESDIRRAEVTAKELRSSMLPSAVTYDRDKVMTTKEDSMSETAARVDELERKISAIKEQKAAAIMEIDDLLNKMAETVGGDKGRMQVDILYFFYIGRQSVYAISQKLEISERHCFRMKKQALKNFMAIYASCHCMSP